MPSAQQSPRKRRRLSTPSEKTNASNHATHQGATSSATVSVEYTHVASDSSNSTSIDAIIPPIITTTSVDHITGSPPSDEVPIALPYRTLSDSTFTETTELPNIITATTLDPPMITLPYTSTHLSRHTPRHDTPTCLPHLLSPYPQPIPPNPVFATPDDKAEYNMDYLTWRRLDTAWRAQRFFELAVWMSTWHDTMVNMFYLYLEGRHYAVREAGVQMGVIPPESTRSLHRRVLEGMRRNAEVQRVMNDFEMERIAALDEEMGRIKGLMEEWKRDNK